MRPPRFSLRPSWMLGAITFASAWWLFDLVVLRAGVPDRLDDTWEYGVAARALLEGHGFRTPVIHPPLWGLRDAALTVPLLIHGPLIPLVIAPFLALFGPGVVDGMAWFAALGALLVVPSLVRLGERCGSAAIGCAAAILWTVAPLTIHSVHHDVALTIGAALLAGALELATRSEPRALAAGIALGLACLARHELLAALPILTLVTGTTGWRLGLGALLCLIPWWTHHALAVGQPLFNLSSYLAIGYWGARPGISVLRDFGLPPDQFAAEFLRLLPSLPAKWLDFAPHAIKRALMVPTAALGWLAWLGAALALISQRTRRDAALFVGVALIPVVVMTITLYDERYLVPFLPLFALAAARAAHDLAQRLPAWGRRPRAWIGLLALIALPVSAPALREEAAQAREHRQTLEGERTAIAAWMTGVEARERQDPRTLFGPLFSDTPDFVAWSTRRPTLWITAEEFGRLPLERDDRDLPVRPAGWRTWFHGPDAGISR